MSNWQDMATAPKDGTYILLSCPKPLGVITGCYDNDKYAKKPRPYWMDRGTFWGVLRTRQNQPTHWMPLPAPPTPEPTVPRHTVERIKGLRSLQGFHTDGDTTFDVYCTHCGHGHLGRGPLECDNRDPYPKCPGTFRAPVEPVPVCGTCEGRLTVFVGRPGNMWASPAGGTFHSPEPAPMEGERNE